MKSHPYGQRGISLPVTLIILVAMIMLGLAAFRAVDTSGQLAGNIAARETTLMGTDAGIEGAITWLGNNLALLTSHQTANGYYATQQNLDVFGESSSLADPAWFVLPSTDSSGNTNSYFITRMCTAPGSPGDAGNLCSSCVESVSSTPENCSKGGGGYGNYAIGCGNSAVARVCPGNTNKTWVFYRIVARSINSRNTASYTEAFVRIEN